MNEVLTTQNLIRCMTEKDKYKGSAPYILKAGQFKEEVYEMFNEALKEVIIKKHNNYMAKLMALRIFRELFLTGNMTLIDYLDE